jgi:hypothetical protein
MEVLALCLVDHTGQFKSLSNLVTQLSSHFDHRGNDEDLDQTITLYRDALALCLVGDTDQPLSTAS